MWSTYISAIFLLIIVGIVFSILFYFMSVKSITYTIAPAYTLDVKISGNKIHIVSDREIPMHIFIMNCSNLRYTHSIVFSSSFEKSINSHNQVLIVITNGNITVVGNYSCISAYVSPCGIYSQGPPDCEPWVKLPEKIMSIKVKGVCIGTSISYTWVGGLIKICIT